MKKRKHYPFQSVTEELESTPKHKKFKFAFTDEEFLLREDLRSVRLLLEYKKAEIIFKEQHIHSTIVICGSSRTLPKEQAQQQYEKAKIYAAHNAHDRGAEISLTKAKKILEMSQFYEDSRQLAVTISSSERAKKQGEFVIVTGGGPGVMEAANRGAQENGAKSIGLSIYLPTEEEPNRFIPEELHVQFHYFAIRKMHFLTCAHAVVFFPGGFGTLDELFETLTLIQTKKIKQIPILLYNRKYWESIVNFPALFEHDMITKDNLKTFEYVETVDETWDKIQSFYDSLENSQVPH